MTNLLLQIIIFGLIFDTTLSTHECNRTISGNLMRFVCPSVISSQLLDIYDLTTTTLDEITVLIASGGTGTSLGPFTSIPPNICLLRNLESIDFTNNVIVTADPWSALSDCLLKLVTIDLSFNRLTTFPSTMTSNKANLKNVRFHHNQLTSLSSTAFSSVATLDHIDFSYNRFTSFELWTFLVQETVNFTNNQITTITNNDYINLPLSSTSSRTILLNSNGPILQLTDAIYAMYDACDEVNSIVFTEEPDINIIPMISFALAFTQFGSTQLNCSCDQYYISRIVSSTVGGPSETSSIPLYNANCSNGVTFSASPCVTNQLPQTSTVDFTQVNPRLCKIFSNETGELTTIPNITVTPTNASARPHYETRWLESGACFYTFLSFTEMSIRCTNDTQMDTMSIPEDLLSSSYMSTITRVSLVSPMSRLANFLCSLPSRVIDLSGQSFTSLTDATFPCLNYFTEVILSGNQISSVDITNGNFTRLTRLDLSSNRLSSIPHSIIDTTPNSLNNLNLQNNSIRQIDLFLYTVRNMSVLLNGNPINSSAIINPMNITLPNLSEQLTNPATNLIFPESVRSSVVVLNDDLAFTALACTADKIQNFASTMRSSFAEIRLDCSCASIYINEFYQNSTLNINEQFNCSEGSSFTTFSMLSLANCSNTTTSLSRCINATSNPSESGLTQTTASDDGSRTGLIVGLVVGLVGFAAIVTVLVGTGLYLKNKNAAAASNKPISRAAATDQYGKPSKTINRASTRNPRAARLPPIHPNPSGSSVPPVPTETTAVPENATTSSSKTSKSMKKSKASRGIPLRTDIIRSPTNVVPEFTSTGNPIANQSRLLPINNLSLKTSISQRLELEQSLRPTTSLNAGGDSLYA